MPEGLGRVKACTNCRMQKLRCNAREDYSQPCSRCKKMGLICEVSKGLKRSQRQTKADLVRENDRLKDQLHAPSRNGPPPLQPAAPVNVNAWNATVFPAGPQAGADSSVSEYSSREGFPNMTSPGAGRQIGSNGFHVTPSTLEYEKIGARKISQCFALFFEHYVQSIPGLFDPAVSPEQHYEQSPFLFWSIVSVGARNFPDDPILLERVVRQIMNIALSSLYSLSNPIPAIEAVLLLCLWPIPINTMFKDPSHALAGAAMQLAVQNGLHIFGHEQDFVRRTLSSPDGDGKLHRARLWIHCVVIFQRTSLCDGLPFWVIPESINLDRNVAMESILPSTLLYRYKLHRIQTNAITAITQNMELGSNDNGATLNSLINVFDSQIQEVVCAEFDEIQQLTHNCARLSIRAFHFFAAADHLNFPGLLQLFAIACKVLDLAASCDAATDFSYYCTHYCVRMLQLAAFCILKITRSELKEHIDVAEAERSAYKAIKFSKKRSVEDNDLDSRNASILTQLFASNNIFKRRDGKQDGLRLRLRSRLFMSVIFDCFWWWRGEFGGQSNPYQEGNSAQTEQRTLIDGNLQILSMAPQIYQPWGPPPSGETFDFQSPPTDFSTFPDWDWAAGLKFFDNMELGLPVLDDSLLPGAYPEAV